MKIAAYFRGFENGATKGFADLYVDGNICIKDVRLVEGKNGMFISMPQRKVGDEYRDVVTGVSKEFAALALEATLAARDSNESHASVGEGGKLYYEPHVTALKKPEGHVKGLASLTVRESEAAEKSAFTINDIRVIQGEKNMFLGMPTEKTNSEDYPYNDLCTFTKGSAEFLTGLILGKAKEVFNHEKKGPALDAKVKEAGDRKTKKPSSKKKAKETEKDR